MIPGQESKSIGPAFTWVFITLFRLQRIPVLNLGVSKIPYLVTLFSKAKVIRPLGSLHSLSMSTCSMGDLGLPLPSF